MPQHNPLNQSQTDTGPLEFFNVVQPLEDPKEFFAVLHVESDAVIPDVISRPIAVHTDPDFDIRILFRSCEFQSIGEKVMKHLANHRSITEGGWQVLKLQFNMT